MKKRLLSLVLACCMLSITAFATNEPSNFVNSFKSEEEMVTYLDEMSARVKVLAKITQELDSRMLSPSPFTGSDDGGGGSHIHEFPNYYSFRYCVSDLRVYSKICGKCLFADVVFLKCEEDYGYSHPNHKPFVTVN